MDLCNRLIDMVLKRYNNIGMMSQMGNGLGGLGGLGGGMGDVLKLMGMGGDTTR